jgi:FdhD protein
LDNGLEKIPILRFAQGGPADIEADIAREFPLTIILNNQELVTLLCSPIDLKYLAVGFLSSEGLLKNRDEIKKIVVDDQRGVIRVETTEDTGFTPDDVFKRLIASGCVGGTSLYRAIDAVTHKVESRMEVSVSEISTLVNRFQHASDLYLATHGVHSAALCDRNRIKVLCEDIGRHNAVDKVLGQCFLEDIPTEDLLLITSGRISSDSVYKTAKRGIPVMVSISVPTNLAISIADGMGITLVGRVIKEKLNVYTNTWRIILH